MKDENSLHATDQSDDLQHDADNFAPAQKQSKKISTKLLCCLFGALLLIVAGVVALLLTKNDPNESSNNASDSSTKSAPITSFAECVAAGNPVQESYPERCVTSDGTAFTNPEQQLEEPSGDSADKSTCSDGESEFKDKEFGARFCYPSAWGDASVMDAKVGTDDTGHREAVRFSATTKFIVGGVSEDWSTTIGRDVACQEPDNRVPELSEYDTEWHDIVGDGMAVNYATRSLEVTEGGYDISEETADLLGIGVCARGHKVINGSRYRVISVAFFSDFSESAGITSPKAHMDNPTILFSSTERSQLDRVLASVVAY